MKKAQVIFIVTNTNEDNAIKIRTAFDSISEVSIKDIKSPDFSKEEDGKINNILEKLPAGSIIAKTKFSSDSNIIICLPAFSSHIQIPIKKGEDVWYFEDESKYNSSNSYSFIKNYWFSRIYSLEEDVNFTHHERDFEKSNENTSKDVGIKNARGANTTRSNNRIKSRTKNSILKPGFKQLESNKSQGNLGVNIDKLIKDNVREGFGFKSIPRFYDNFGSTTIQGSNNSIINLGNNIINRKDTGAIDIVTGRLSLIDQVYRESVRKTKNYSILSESNSKTGEKTSIEYNEKYPFYSIENSLNYKEVLKDVTHYVVGNNELKGSIKEFNKDIEADSSRIYVTESDNLDSNYIENDYINYQSNISLDENNVGERFINFINNGKLSFSLDNNKNSLFASYSGQYPSVLTKTNHIRLYARKTVENTSIDSSSIRLVKESKDYKNYSHICLEDNGNILIDGNKILIGNFKRAALDQRVITEENIKEIIDNSNDKQESSFSSNFEQMSGNGETIILGHSELYSEPLVLGNSLVSLLTSLLESNIEVLKKIDSSLSKIETHTHNIIAPTPGSPTAPMGSLALFSVTKDNISIKNQIPILEDLKDNIVKVLSKVSKSS